MKRATMKTPKKKNESFTPEQVARWDARRVDAITRSVVTMTIGERAARARRACILAAAVIDPRRDDERRESIADDVTLPPQEAQAIIEELNAAAMDLFWIERLQDDLVLNTPAPSDDERLALDRLAKRSA